MLKPETKARYDRVQHWIDGGATVRDAAKKEGMNNPASFYALKSELKRSGMLGNGAGGGKKWDARQRCGRRQEVGKESSTGIGSESGCKSPNANSSSTGDSIQSCNRRV